MRLSKFSKKDAQTRFCLLVQSSKDDKLRAERRDSEIRERKCVGWEDKVRERAVILHLCACRSFVRSELSALFEIFIALMSWQTRHRPGRPCG